MWSGDIHITNILIEMIDDRTPKQWEFFTPDTLPETRELANCPWKWMVGSHFPFEQMTATTPPECHSTSAIAPHMNTIVFCSVPWTWTHLTSWCNVSPPSLTWGMLHHEYNSSSNLWVSDFPIFPPWELINWFWSQPLHPWHRSHHFDAWIQKWHGPRALPQRPTKNASGGLKQCRQWRTRNWNISCSDVLVRPQLFQHNGLNDFFFVTQVAEADEWYWFIWQNKTWLQQERITGLYQ